MKKSLYECWLNSDIASLKLSNYFPIYEDVFSHLVDTECTFVETGVLDGGSLLMWRDWLGPKARIIGIDLNPSAVKWREFGFEIYIGDQADNTFWDRTFKDIGVIDGFCDDGGHKSIQQIITVLSLLLKSGGKTSVVIEDTYTSYMHDFAAHGENSFVEFCKALVDCLNAKTFHLYPDRLPKFYNEEFRLIVRSLRSISFHPGIVSFRIDDTENQQIEVLRKGRKIESTDFRDEGISSVDISWPSISESSTLPISGVTCRSIHSFLGKDNPIKLNLGCGDKLLPGYINVDAAPSNNDLLPDIICDVRSLESFPDNIADEILAVHVIEHFWRWEVVNILRAWRRVLKPGGKIILECPNLESACREFLKEPYRLSLGDRMSQRTMWVFYGDPSWKKPLMMHRWGYIPMSLAHVMHQSGFTDLRKEQAQYKLREPRDMRISGRKPKD